jgi:hypothetical protein
VDKTITWGRTGGLGTFVWFFVSYLIFLFSVILICLFIYYF